MLAVIYQLACCRVLFSSNESELWFKMYAPVVLSKTTYPVNECNRADIKEDLNGSFLTMRIINKSG